MGDGDTQQSNPHNVVFSFNEVADQLKVSDDALSRLSTRFSQYLSFEAANGSRNFSNADIAALVAVQKLLAQGYTDDQISNYLTPTRPSNDARHSENAEPALTSPSDNEDNEDDSAGSKPAAEDFLNTIISNQQAILNSQATLREMVNVIIQDNFSLKDENRKLRDRMLELERVLAEYQRREETRKERVEHRIRALEGTVGALQQQLAQIVQIYRNQGKRGGGWFG